MKIISGIKCAVVWVLLSSSDVSASTAVSKSSRKVKAAVPTVSITKPSFGVRNIEPKKASKRTLVPVSTKVAVAMGMILSFNSGLINGATLSGLLADGTKQGTSALTGAWTNSALSAASGASAQVALHGKSILSYMTGSMISGLVIPRPSAFNLDVTGSMSLFAVASALLVTAASLASSSNINYLFLCCLANGIQNSLTSTLTANLCRTAHFTGITSDIGTFLGQRLRGNKENILKLKTFASLGACFWAGGYLSYGLTKNHGISVLEIAAMIHLFFALFLALNAFGIIGFI